MNRVLDALFGPRRPVTYPGGKTGIAAPAPGFCEAMGNALCCFTKGGHNGENHNHNDVGTFLLFTGVGQ